MNTYVAFLRAINVGGRAIVKMTDLRDAFAAAGCKGVRTYIQSGNVVFEAPARDSAAVFQRVRAKLRKLFRKEPEVLFRTVRELEAVVQAAPLKRFAGEPAVKLYVAFLARRPRSKPSFPLRSSQEALEVVGMKNREAFIVSRRKKSGFYGFPNNFIEQELRVSATSRNWSTVSKIVEFVRATPDG